MNSRFAVGIGAFVLMMAAIDLAAGPAFGQGFMVKPMRMEFAARPGQTVEMGLELRNTAGDAAKALDLALVELTQTAEGAWSVVEPGSKADVSGLASCLKWISLEAKSVEVAPAEPKTVKITVAVPATARGYYFAGLIAQTRPPADARGIRVVVRFLIPILVEIQGRPERQQIDLADVGMAFRKAEGDKPGGTIVTLGVNNDGRTYSRVRGDVRIVYWNNERWRPVATAEFVEKGIIPGAKLRLPLDLGRRLPSGKYKLTATICVDGRRIKPLEKEIEFEGDPAVTRLPVDSALVLEPAEITLAAMPGATRTAVVQVENAGEDAVTVESSTLLPPTLAGVAIGELRGDALSCAEWLSVAPAKFTLAAGRKQNVRVVARVPRDKLAQATYYGMLSLKAGYGDGQSAGETRVLVCLTNQGIAAAPAGQVARMALSADEGSKYVIQVQAANVGNVHFTPKVEAALLTGRGDRVTQAALSGEDGLMLPLQTRSYSGVIDFASVEPGAYALRVVLELAVGKAVAEQMLVNVAEEGGRKAVTVVRTEATTQADAAATAPAKD